MKCINCEFYKKDESYYGFGKCKKIIDSNSVEMLFEGEQGKQVDNRFAYTWDLESVYSGAYVGENFGCIHFNHYEIKNVEAQKHRQEQAEIESLEKAKLEIEAMLNKKG